VAGLRAGAGGALVLDAEGIVKLAQGDLRALSRLKEATIRRSQVLTAASTVAEVLRGGARDAALHRVLNQISVVPIDKALGRYAGELMGRTGLSGHRCTLDALLAAVALNLPRPVVLLTSDPRDLSMLTDEPQRPKAERVAVVKV
jgi:predicted nucleic acid-binding protein